MRRLPKKIFRQNARPGAAGLVLEWQVPATREVRRPSVGMGANQRRGVADDTSEWGRQEAGCRLQVVKKQ